MSLELSGTTGVKGVAGSVSAPSIVGDDTNTGISFPSADTIKFSTGGVERMSITNSGVSGVGKVLQVVSTTKTDVTTIGTGTDSFYNYDDASLKVTITPSSASNKILLLGNLCCSSNPNVGAMFVRFNKDGGALAGAIGDSSGNRGRMTTAAIQHSVYYPTFHSLSFLDTAGDTNSRYYNFGIAQNAGSGRNVKINDHYTTSDAFGSGLFISTITAMEIAA